MELDKRLWYVRWFFFSQMIWDEFYHSGNSSRYAYGTNLCHFMRVTLVLCPLVLVLHGALYASVVAIFIGLPVYLAGGIGYALILACIGVIASVIWGSKRLMNRMRQSKRERTLITGPSYAVFLWSYVVALKRKMCPILTFKQQGNV